MQNARGQTLHNVERFTELIKSIEKHGFCGESNILVDGNMQLIDGSHRLACALYFDAERIPIRIQPQLTNIKYDVEWFRSAGFNDQEINIICEKQKDIIQKKGIYFVATLWAPVQVYFDDITKELSHEYTLLSVKDYTFQNDHEFATTIKGLYAIDDIEDWKIEKKLEYMMNYDKKIRVITFDIGEPKFRTKVRNNKPISTEVEKIKKNYREKYSKKIDNYFYDIIMHIGDNYEHSEHMMKIIRKDIDIFSFLQSINSFRYALVKVDVPYMPSQFPYDYPLGKDMDIICEKEDFEQICEKAFEFGERYSKKYKVRIINEEEKFRLRFELKNFLLYQIDISCGINGLKQSFIRNAIKSRIKTDSYFILDKKYEIVVRMNEYIQNPQKI